jgi:Protein of unknown function (DUF2721)
MDASDVNPLAVLTFISAPAVLTNASCVLLFGAGNRYARAVDRMHELAKAVDALTEFDTEESRLRVTQLQAAEDRALYIVRALTCFYGSVAAFVASTLIGLLSGIVANRWAAFPAGLAFGSGLVVGCVGVFSMITGSFLLIVETRDSFTVLREEKKIIGHRLQRRAEQAKAHLTGSSRNTGQ